jgi:preprotein translocase subunit SecF
MQLIKPGIHIDFVGKMKYAIIFSVILTIISILSVIFHGGLNLGIDFAGGSIIQVKFQKDMTADKIRDALKSTRLEKSIIQQFGANEFLLRTQESFHDQKLLDENVNKPLSNAFGKDYEIRRVEIVGSKVGMDFQRKAIFAVILSWLAMLTYIAWRFEFRYGLGGIIALVHDVIIIIGTVSILKMEFTISILAAIFFIIGYSINDTIVVLDRIRENVKLNPRQKLAETINTSINQTLSRTILTSFTVFLTVIALYIWGGPVLHDLAFSLLVGVVFGTYSSIFISCPIVLFFENLQLAKLKRKK